MAKVAKESDVAVTFEDQGRINKFARVNAKLQDLKEDLESKKKELENLEDAENEILMTTDDDPVPFMIGEVFVHCDQTDANSMLERAKAELESDIEGMQQRCEGHKSILSELKVQLYAKFGNNINLEAEDES